MRADLERLGRYDEHRVRQRLRDSFSLEHTSIVELDGDFAGSVTVRPADGGLSLEHFYLAPAFQGRGLGSAVLHTLLEQSDAQGMTVRLNVLQGSPARHLYERCGFTLESETRSTSSCCAHLVVLEVARLPALRTPLPAVRTPLLAVPEEARLPRSIG